MDPVTYASLIVDRPMPELGLGPAVDPTATVRVVAVGTGLEPDEATRRVLTDAGADLSARATEAAYTGKAGAPLTLLAGGHRLLAVGTGDGSTIDWRRAGAAIAQAGTRGGIVDVHLPPRLTPDRVTALAEGVLLGAYTPIASGTRERPAPVRAVRLIGEVDTAAVEAGRVSAATGWLSRDLAGAPSDIKNPPWLARLAVDLADRHGLHSEVLAGGDLAHFGCLLAVGAASPTPPRVVVLRHRPTDAVTGSRHIVLVGKGITFDTGGLNLKPGEAMVPMRTDMTGAAAVLAAIVGAARSGVAVNVTAVLALAENAIGAGAYRPGDVLRAYDGTTVEIGNTDAEGRLALADALSYAGATLAPDVLVDVATLTGAATLGLGRQHAALYTGDDDLATELDAAGDAAGERVWRMPLVEDYTSVLDSDVADVSHIATGDRPGGGGSITAALFLRRFVDPASTWVHLDIAGPARSDKASHEIPKGPTGYGARLLLRWLLDETGALP